MSDNKENYKRFYYRQAYTKAVVIAMTEECQQPLGSTCITGFFPLCKNDVATFKMVHPDIDHTLIARISKVWQQYQELNKGCLLRIISRYSVE